MNDNSPFYSVPPEDIPAFKDLRVVIDKGFLCNQQLWARCTAYLDFYPTLEGVEKQIRSLLFPDSKTCKRGQAVEPVDTTNGRRPRGRPRKGTVLTEDEVKAAEKARQESTRRNQQHSKSRERLENRLLSLLVSSMFEINTRECRFLSETPPMKLMRKDYKGNNRSSSNYEKVRKHLRKVMITLISKQCSAIRAVVDLASVHADLLPGMLLPLARTFLAIHTLTNHEQLGCISTIWIEGSDDDSSQSPMELALEDLGVSCQCVVDYTADWWRRNLKSDVQLANSACFKRDYPMFSACENLLRTMIRVVPPSHPSTHFKQQFLFRAEGDTPSTCVGAAKRSCFLCVEGTTGEMGIPQPTVEVCHDFCDALTKCCSFAQMCSPMALERLISTQSCNCSIPAWKHVYAQDAFHRLGVRSRDLRSRPDTEDAIHTEQAQLFVKAVHRQVSSLWVSFYTSNGGSMELLHSLNIDKPEVMRRTVVEGIFGGSVAARALLERSAAIRRVAKRLLDAAQLKKASTIRDDDDKPSESSLTNDENRRSEEFSPQLQPRREDIKWRQNDMPAIATSKRSRGNSDPAVYDLSSRGCSEHPDSNPSTTEGHDRDDPEQPSNQPERRKSKDQTRRFSWTRKKPAEERSC